MLRMRTVDLQALQELVSRPKSFGPQSTDVPQILHRKCVARSVIRRWTEKVDLSQDESTPSLRY
jgi:hypothetical protein